MFNHNIGLDMTKISRFQELKKSTIIRILSAEEFIEFDELKSDYEKQKFLATRWCIKEAMFKADNAIPAFDKITIIKKQGAYIHSDFMISTTDEDDLIIAVVVKK
ncbi:Holo-[acyl-carrier protein]synthase [Mycoplasmopsis agalactiae 14628]|uniref:Holo-[acyl-carrier protein]synthase n=2 Tax=Mycoplasmopsis agalactiae TaxID=2110 RepID=I5D544_MYCAA|nr:Holo-[acyl-carrier protein]synthase [Mycoplasmopsis agalactiae 14628]